MGKVAYFFIKYPRTSQAFLQREIQALAEGGLEIEIFSMWSGRSEPGLRLPPGVTLHEIRPWHYLALLWRLPRECHYRFKKIGAGFRLIRQYRPTHADNWIHTLLGTATGLLVANQIRRSTIRHLHGAWATGPATAAALAAHFTGLPYSFGAHAYDIYLKGGDALLYPKLRTCAFVHTTTEAGRDRLLEVDPSARDRIILARRGLASIPDFQDPNTGRTLGTDQADVLRLLSVARLVPKKNHGVQLDALRLLRNQGVHAQLTIIGDGPLRPALIRRAQTLNLLDHVVFAGELSQAAVQRAYPQADLFLHTGIIDATGDRDGLPNVVPEAMAHGLPVVCSPTPGVTEAVKHLRTGLVVDPLTAQNLATSLLVLREDPFLRAELITNARAWVEAEFMAARNVQKLAERFNASLGG
jgi:glycosyltransferase involved in cell wall biosynthesis